MSNFLALRPAGQPNCTALSGLKFRRARTLEGMPLCPTPDYSKRIIFSALDVSLDSQMHPPLFLQKAHDSCLAAEPATDPKAASAATGPALRGPTPVSPGDRARRFCRLAVRVVVFLSGATIVVCMMVVSAAGALIFWAPDGARQTNPTLRIAFASPAMAAQIRLGPRKLVRRRVVAGPIRLMNTAIPESFAASPQARFDGSRIEISPKKEASRNMLEPPARSQASGSAIGVANDVPAIDTGSTGAASGNPVAPALTKSNSQPHTRAPEPQPARSASEAADSGPSHKKLPTPKRKARVASRSSGDDEAAEVKSPRRMQLGGATSHREARRPVEKAESEETTFFNQAHPAWAREVLFRD